MSVTQDNKASPLKMKSLLYTLWLSLCHSPEAHDEAPVMESTSTLDAVLVLRVRDLHLCAALYVMDHVAVDDMSIQTLH